MAYYSLKDKEGTIINNVREDFFKDYDCRKLIGNIDFSVAIPQTGKELFPEIEYVLWAEAKQGDKHSIYESFIQLILTIGKERTIDKHLPPKFIGAFDAEKIAFIPYSAIMEVFTITDFNWNVAPSDHESKEFKLLKEIVRRQLDSNSKEIDNVYYFDFYNDKKELQRFIRNNFVSGREDVRKIRINQNNFTHIYDKWRKEVKPTIDVKWENVKKSGLLDADFFLADVMSKDNVTLQEKLHVLLRSNQYELDREYIEGFLRKTIVDFTDGMRAHTKFWNKYDRPPREEYRTKILNRRDLLVPQDVRERKGSYFTPAIWVEKSQEYLANVLGEDWQENYYIWDCCAGTGNLLKGLTNKYNIWASTLDKADVQVMLQDIEDANSKNENGSHLLPSHVFQFDFLNDDFDKLPQGLRDIINDEEKRKKLVIYINPPYAESGDRRQTTGTGKNKANVASESWVYKKYQSTIGTAARELYAQFLTRIYNQIPDCFIAQFSTLKGVQASNFKKYRQMFLAKLRSLFLVPANTFDNVTGTFPIGFFIWDTSIHSSFEGINADLFDSHGVYCGTKNVFSYDNDRLVIEWLRNYFDREGKLIGYLRMKNTDIQNKSHIFITSMPSEMDFQKKTFTYITKANLIPMVIYVAIRAVVEATWQNDRDQFLYPNEGWLYDRDFQSDCLAYMLFENRITSAEGINHWIPFTEPQVKAPDNFQSHFMSDFIAGKLASKNADTLFGKEESLIPSEPIIFTPAAQAVMEAGRKIWEYYMKQKPKTYGADPINVNASFYDIRAYFQGRDEKGKMNSDSKDETYTALMKELRTYQKVLAKQIEKKVYLYGFLKGEVQYTQEELAAKLLEAERKNAALEHQLQAQQHSDIHYHINAQNISLQTEGTINIGEINDK